MYYLMDLSQSMSDDLENLRSLGSKLTAKMKDVTGNKPKNFRIGYGSFVDKTVLPFVSTVPAKLKNPCTAEKPCEPPYTFRSNLALTSGNLSIFRNHAPEYQDLTILRQKWTCHYRC